MTTGTEFPSLQSRPFGRLVRPRDLGKVLGWLGLIRGVKAVGRGAGAEWMDQRATSWREPS
jgi:hypothetical protein